MLTSSTVLALALFGLPSFVQPTQIAQTSDRLIDAPPVDDAPLAPSSSDSSSSEPAAPADVPDVLPTANYSDGRVSIDYPISWLISVEPDGTVQILDGTKGSADEVITEIFVIDSPPGVLINANIDSFIEEGAAVGPYGQVTIDDQQAFTIWLADRPRTLSRAIATFIGYEDQTVLLFSSFRPENEIVEDRLIDLHSSFQKVADAASGDSLDPDSSLDPDGSLDLDSLLDPDSSL
ncbi:MAG: hypothetical protein AAF716_08155 [Cyanobacteria bacterium P01_D01_bin.1]